MRVQKTTKTKEVSERSKLAKSRKPKTTKVEPAENIEASPTDIVEKATPSPAVELVVVAEAETPTRCCCGCGESVPTKRLFKIGHDGRLHGLLIRILKGKASADQIPQEARQNIDRIGFIQKHPELREAFKGGLSNQAKLVRRSAAR